MNFDCLPIRQRGIKRYNTIQIFNMKKKILLVVSFIIILYFTYPQKVNLPLGDHCDYNKTCFWMPWGDHMHNGIDIFAKTGDSIKSATYGIVINIRRNTKIGGNTVSILGTKGRVYYYAHMNSIDVCLGQFVTDSTTIGTAGNTGNAINTPPHLHFSIFSFWEQGKECHKDSKYSFYCLNPIKEFS